MATYLDIKNWNRKDQFYFFKDYDHPFFNICADVDVTELLKQTKALNKSFFITSLYMSLKAANDIQEFRYRILEDQIIIHDVIHAGSTVLNKNDTFSFCYFDYFDSFAEFEKNAKQVLKKHEESGGAFDPRNNQDNMIHYSVIPWISFTSFAHARRFNQHDSIPKIVFGKYRQDNNIYKMPVSVEVHHSLMDGLHVGKFFERLQFYNDDAANFLNPGSTLV